MATLKPGWSSPSTILFAAEYPANEKAFACALAQAVEFRSDLIIFHVYGIPEMDASGASSIRGYEYSTARAQKRLLESLAQRAMDIGIHSKIVVRQGMAADQILIFLRERRIDHVVVGTRSPGPVGKLLVGSVAEAVLRNANVPVCIVGANVVEGTYHNPVTRKILCDVSVQEASQVMASFGAELALRKKASLILQKIIPPQDRAEFLAGRTITQIEAELPSLVPVKLKQKVYMQARVTFGDPTEELLLYQGRAQQASLIVLGAHGASHFAAISGSGIFYKVLAYAHCPVVTLSPVLLAQRGIREEQPRQSVVNYMAGVF